MSDDNKDNDGNSFRKAMGEMRPLKQDRITPTPRKTQPIPRKALEDEQAVMDSLLSDNWDGTEIETGEELYFVRPGIQHRMMRKLRRGKYAIENELDLHGLYVPDAREALIRFLQNAQDRGLRCVRIIHGKGKGSAGGLPVLKNKLNQWLRQKDEVLAFCSAQAHDGGTGAVYVLLKKRCG